MFPNPSRRPKKIMKTGSKPKTNSRVSTVTTAPTLSKSTSNRTEVKKSNSKDTRVSTVVRNPSNGSDASNESDDELIDMTNCEVVYSGDCKDNHVDTTKTKKAQTKDHGTVAKDDISDVKSDLSDIDSSDDEQIVKQRLNQRSCQKSTSNNSKASKSDDASGVTNDLIDITDTDSMAVLEEKSITDNFNKSDDDSEVSVDFGTGPSLRVKKREPESITKIMEAINAETSPRHVSVNSKRSRVFPDGYLKIVIGCMFSGKTTYIIRECKKWQSIGKHVLMINYALDRRYSDADKVVSHDKYSVDCIMVDKFTPDLTKKVEDYDVVLINEGQFFNDLNQNVRRWCDDMKKIVVVSGLDGNYLRGKFGEILDLIPDCDELIKLKALCSMCKDGTEAPFTWKIKDNPTNTSVVVDIGTDKYVPLCRKHYNRENSRLTQKTTSST
ncbi:thymidine kinase [Yasminevirus sp. GU-2018]|uniref:Thymidine kinase n=1 Tax=Yasminevirus sp. GU-2018 TaxID=2420051 RepID=A0A5K0UAY6_9VIRU|nr:thymidine kinase [Yasminevirus sp. GU-2018]